MTPPEPDVRSPKLVRRTLPPFVRRFLETEAAGGIVLAGGRRRRARMGELAVARHVRDLLAHDLSCLRIGTFGFAGDLHTFVNDGLMAVFFFVVGLEIKRELSPASCAIRAGRALPAIAAARRDGRPGRDLPRVQRGQPRRRRMGHPDGDRHRVRGRRRRDARRGRARPSPSCSCSTLAVVDDVGAILVIAIVYTERVDGTALALAALAVVATIVLRRLRVHWLPVYVVGVRLLAAAVPVRESTPRSPAWCSGCSCRCRRLQERERVAVGADRGGGAGT